MMTPADNEEVTLTKIFVAFALIIPVLVLLSVIVWAVYSPIQYEETYNRLVSVNTSGLILDNNITCMVADEAAGWGHTRLSFRDNQTHQYYTIRLVDGPDYGASLPIAPWENINVTYYNTSVNTDLVLNPCVHSQVIITTDSSYLIKEFNQTVICG